MKLQGFIIGLLLSSIVHVISQDKNWSEFTVNPGDSIEMMKELEAAKEVYRNHFFDSVLVLCEVLLKESDNIGFIRVAGEAYFLEARALNRLGRRNKAIEMYQIAMGQFKQIGDHGRMASTYNNWGLLLKASGRFREAIEAGENALQQVEFTTNRKLKFHILNNLGNSYQSLALFKKAANSYFSALEMLRFEQDSLYKKGMQAEVYINLGLVYFKQRLYERALETFNNARYILENQSMTPQLAVVYYNLGLAYAETKQYKSAELFVQLSQKLYKSLNDELGLILCDRANGKVLFAKKMYPRAIDLHLKTVRKLEELEAFPYLPYSYQVLGETYLAAEKPDKAELALLRGLQIALRAGQKVEELKIYEGLIELHKSQNKLEIALMYYDIHSALTQELNDQQIGRLIGRFELKELLYKRDKALETLEHEAAILQFQVLKKNKLLILSISLLIMSSVLFILILRQHKLKALNKTISLEQMILRAQLNPHFIFNALGAIQHYINLQASDKAALYLSKFSKLMRAVLDGSRTKTASLSTELTTLRNYLDLQALRFMGTFEYKIHVEETLELDLIEIPSLIIQPLVENAIEHGLLPNHEGIIEISLKEVPNGIEVMIDDNGIGIKPDLCDQISENKTSGLGIIITRKRLALFGQKHRKNTHLELINKSQLDPDAKGTRARLKIPII